MQPPPGGSPPGDPSRPGAPPGGAPASPGTPHAQPPAGKPHAQPPQNPYAQPPQNPYAQPPAGNPYAQPPAGNPYAQPPQNPYAQPPQNPYAQPPGQHGAPPGPNAPPAPPAAPRPSGIVQNPLPRAEVHRQPAPPGEHGFVDLLALSLRRALRLRIEPGEVTPAERRRLEQDGITEPSFQAFLSWRRSMLLAFATLIIPLMALKAYELYSVEALDAGTRQMQEDMRNLQLLPLLAEAAFCLLAWSQLSRWTSWRKQRRTLFYGWLVFFVAPFAVAMVPLRDLLPAMPLTGDPAMDQQIKGTQLLIGMVGSLQAMIHLGPKAVSLVAGMVRGSLVTKLLFPGASAPGWLVVLGAVLYSLFIYVVLVVPFQITGSYYFVGAICSIVIGEVLLARGGYRLARPMTRDEAIAGVKKARGAYFTAIICGAVFILLAMRDMIEVLDFTWLTVVNLIGTFLTNVWILSIITTDLLIDSLDRARLSATDDKLIDETGAALGAFVGMRTVAPGQQQVPAELLGTK